MGNEIQPGCLMLSLAIMKTKPVQTNNLEERVFVIDLFLLTAQMWKSLGSGQSCCLFPPILIL